MTTADIIAAIDQQLSLLRQAKGLLLEPAPLPTSAERRGRPKGSKKATTKIAAPPVQTRTKRPMSADGKARIAAAQKARWAAVKGVPAPAKAVAKKVARKKAK